MDMKVRGLLWFQSQMASIDSYVWMPGCMLDNKCLGMTTRYHQRRQGGPASLQQSLRGKDTQTIQGTKEIPPKFSNSMLKAKDGQAEALLREPSRHRLAHSPTPHDPQLYKKKSLWCSKPGIRWASTEYKQEPYSKRTTIFKALGLVGWVSVVKVLTLEERQGVSPIKELPIIQVGTNCHGRKNPEHQKHHCTLESWTQDMQAKRNLASLPEHQQAPSNKQQLSSSCPSELESIPSEGRSELRADQDD